jgi:hypothetical protein
MPRAAWRRNLPNGGAGFPGYLATENTENTEMGNVIPESRAADSSGTYLKVVGK